MRLSRRDIAILKALSSGQSVDLSSDYRARLEMLGLVRDGAGGRLAITLEGTRQAASAFAIATEVVQRKERKRDVRGYRTGSREVL